MSARLELVGLRHTYADAAQPAVESVDLVVEPGELVALLGPSGCGKTTVLRAVAGLLRPTAGDVLVDGDSVLGVRPEDRPVAMVFQQPLLFPHMDVAGNVGFGLRMRGVDRREVADRVEEMLELVRLPGLGARRAGELSGGQQQRVSLARALVVEPRLLLLDEPLSALDASLRGELRELLTELRSTLDVTTLLVTHDQEEAVVLADRVALLLDGEVRQVGTPSSFYRRPATPAVAAFFGTHNQVPGTLGPDGFTCTLGVLDVTPADDVEGPATLLLRPEALLPGDGPNTMSGVVRRTLDVGTHRQVDLEVGGTTLRWHVHPSTDVTVGATTTVHVAPDDAWVVPRR